MNLSQVKSINKRHQVGFTLIELIVVIVIIGILATIVIGAFRTLPDTAKNSANLATARTIYSTAAASETQTPGSQPSIDDLLASGLLESDPGDEFKVEYDPIRVIYPTADGGQATYPK